MKRYIISFIKAVALAIVAAERQLFFLTGIRPYILDRFYRVKSREIQRALDARAPQRERCYERREAELLAKAEQWRKRQDAIDHRQQLRIVYISAGAVA